MRFAQALKKNLRLLFRSKETAFTIIFGPLLIILLVGFAFSGEQELSIALGVYAEQGQYTPLADEIIQTLQNDYDVNIWANKEQCLEQVQIGINHMCIIFPEDFIVREQHTNIVEFHVDPSRVNLVYQVIDQLGNEFDLQRQELSLGLTGNILNNLNTTRIILKEQIANVEEIQTNRGVAAQLLDETEGKLESTDINFSTLDLRQVRGQATSIEQDVQQLYELGIEQLDEAITALRDFENECDECSNQTKDEMDVTIKEFEAARDEFHAIYDGSPQKLQEIYYLIDDTSTRLDEIKESYDEIQTDSGFVKGQVDGTRLTLDRIKEKLTEVKANLNYAHELLTGVSVVDGETIVSPIKTSIQEVTSERGNLTFTYPYILMLVIMFMGLMLGSTLIVTDKNSRAAFRNFTTATRDEFHILVSFLTTLLILLAQVSIILLFSYFLVPAPLLSNFGTTFLVILIAITLFSFIGMMVGFLARSQEAAMITSLTAGSIMLFVSNLVIPTEGMKAFVRLVAEVNPYVLLSEILKKSMLFGVKIGNFGGRLILVVFFMVLLLVLIFMIQHYSRKRYFRQQATVEATTVTSAAKPLVLGKNTVHNEFELLTVLDLMTRQEFTEFANAKQNLIHLWALKELQNKKLASKLKTTNKERMIIKLDNYLKKQTKKRTKK